MKKQTESMKKAPEMWIEWYKADEPTVFEL